MMHFYQFSFVYSAENAYLCLHETINQKTTLKFINPFNLCEFVRLCVFCVLLTLCWHSFYFIFIELPSFTKKEDECETDFERWIYVLKNMETLQRLPFKARKAVFEKLEQIVDIAAMSKEDRMKYDESIKVYRDQLVMMEFERQQGEALGFIKGKAEGIAEGRAEGLAEGEANERLKNVRGMKAAGIAPDLIAQITGLDLETIKRL